MKIGFIGLGNVGGKLAGNLLNNAVDLTVRDLDRSAAEPFLARGARWAESAAALARDVDIVITCLPSPAASAAVMDGEDGLLDALGPGKIWAEMSTTDADEMTRLATLVEDTGAKAIECPVSGGCHRAATGNISIFAGGDRDTFEAMLPVLTILGRRVLHTGPIGSASKLKVMTNFLATTHLVALAEALTTMAAAGLDLATTYKAIRISSGNSFVHETESQVILNGSRDINFTMDLVLKDIGLFQDIAEAQGVPLALSPLIVSLFEEANDKYGGRELSPNIIRRYEDATGLDIHAPGFPAEIVDHEPAARGHEVTAKRSLTP
ncbi:MAG: NAD(P)-dependent oxidoreductase [Pseudomonadota bacterium]